MVSEKYIIRFVRHKMSTGIPTEKSICDNMCHISFEGKNSERREDREVSSKSNRVSFQTLVHVKQSKSRVPSLGSNFTDPFLTPWVLAMAWV